MSSTTTLSRVDVDPFSNPDARSLSSQMARVRLTPQATGSSTSASTNPFRNGTSAAYYHSTGGVSRAQSVATRTSHGERATKPPVRTPSDPHGARPRRTSSLRERYPGDPSVSMLAQIRRDERRANRGPHLRARHLHGADAIDKLDAVPGTAYHHASPYDAASLARNHSPSRAPLAALAHSTAETLKATPHGSLRDSLHGRRPLDGVALFASGTTDPLGQAYEYEEGTDMMREANPEGGAYKRWPGVDYHPDDLKGKGEPSFSQDRRLKEHGGREDDGAIEMTPQPRKERAPAGHRKSLSGELRRRMANFKHELWI